MRNRAVLSTNLTFHKPQLFSRLCFKRNHFYSHRKRFDLLKLLRIKYEQDNRLKIR